jgi:hypothetical protein
MLTKNIRDNIFTPTQSSEQDDGVRKKKAEAFSFGEYNLSVTSSVSGYY